MKYLTERELNVLFYLASGLTNNEIYSALNISVHTTKAQLESIFEKLGVKNRVQAAIKAVSLELVDIKTLV